uniref:Putative D-alanyl-glycyl endopeptidase n=1 Tax=Trypanosoma vivax (strain Y486) TaxID=1055687 RepID=G0UBX9_TRYVY|nr:putative D-alanyl-glycyl endopeptidase [Trypanosoma vivax Y486]
MLRGTPAPAVFDSVVGAADIWQLDHAELMSGLRTPLLKYANGLPSKAGGSAPRVGDLLIYPRQPGFPYGHVAVVVGLSSDSVLVAEQNWSNDYWPLPHRNYSRRIPMQLDPEDQSYTIVEGPPIVVTGWVRSG